MIVLDRFEGGQAVLEMPDGSMQAVPRAVLPDGAREGDLLRQEDGRFVLDRQATLERREQMNELLRRVLQNKKNR